MDNVCLRPPGRGRKAPAPLLLALDISTRTGWAASDGSGGVVDFTSSPELGVSLMGWLSDMITTKRPSLIVIEAPPRKALSASSSLVSNLVFLAHTIAAMRDVKRVEVWPTQWRKVILGKGNMKRTEAKAAAMEWCRQRGISPADDNEADARCILAWMEGQ